MKRTLIAIGGGELKSKETREIDAYIARLARARAGENRANALFFPTASHDSLPYFNTFRKTYTSDNGLKADVALLTKKDIPLEKIAEKISVADVIYVGGGNTLFMLDVWKQTGVDKMILAAYERGVILAGLSAGAICWFEEMYSDADIMNGGEGYAVYKGLGVVKGLITPHYDDRRADFSAALSDGQTAYAIENKAALVFENEELAGALTSGGKAFWVTKTKETVAENIINAIAE